MENIRLFYKKTGRLKFISHLDMNRFIIRMLRRSHLPVWYTEGFNRHVYVNFALPLTLGFESLYEAVDFRLVEPVPFKEIEERLRAVMPPEIEIIGAAQPVYKPKDIKFASYDAVFYGADLTAGLEEFLSAAEIMVEKTGKKGKSSVIDLKPLIKNYSVEYNGCDTVLSLLLPAGVELNINPNLLISAFMDGRQFSCGITRKMLYVNDLKKFE